MPPYKLSDELKQMAATLYHDRFEGIVSRQYDTYDQAEFYHQLHLKALELERKQNMSRIVLVLDIDEQGYIQDIHRVPEPMPEDWRELPDFYGNGDRGWNIFKGTECYISIQEDSLRPDFDKNDPV